MAFTLGESQIPLPSLGNINMAVNIARTLGIDIPGPMDAIGGILGGIGGGGQSQRNIVFDGFNVSSLGRYSEAYDLIPGMPTGFKATGGVLPKDFRTAQSIINKFNDMSNRLFAQEKSNYKLLGLDDLSLQYQNIYNQIGSRTPSSPNDAKNMADQRIGVVEGMLKHRDSIINSVGNSPEFVSNFEQQANMPFSEFQKGIRGLFDTQFNGLINELSTAKLKQIQGSLDSSFDTQERIKFEEPDTKGFTPLIIDQEQVGFFRQKANPHPDENPREIITTAEYNRRLALATQKAGDRSTRINPATGDASHTGNLRKRIGQTQSELDRLSGSFSLPSGVFGSTFVGPALLEELAKGDIDSISLPDDDSGTQQPTDQDPFSQEAQDFFNQREEELESLITQQEKDAALQQDEDATPEDKRLSALGLLGLTSTFLINSLNNPDSQNRVSQQRNVALSGNLSGGSGSIESSLDRDVNVFEAPHFQPINQEDFVRPDAPLTIIPENPSSFPGVAERGKQGLLAQEFLRQQNRGLLA